MKFISKVKGFEGLCYPTWLNTNCVCIRQSGGVTGFFKLKKKADLVKVRFLFWDIWLRASKQEFHGKIIPGKKVNYVVTTKGLQL